MPSKVFQVTIINLPLRIPYGRLPINLTINPISFDDLLFGQLQASFPMKLIQKQLSTIHKTIWKMQLSFNDNPILTEALELRSIMKLLLCEPWYWCMMTLIGPHCCIAFITRLLALLFFLNELQPHLLNCLEKVKTREYLNRGFPILVFFRFLFFNRSLSSPSFWWPNRRFKMLVTVIFLLCLEDLL